MKDYWRPSLRLAYKVARQRDARDMLCRIRDACTIEEREVE